MEAPYRIVNQDARNEFPFSQFLYLCYKRKRIQVVRDRNNSTPLGWLGHGGLESFIFFFTISYGISRYIFIEFYQFFFLLNFNQILIFLYFRHNLISMEMIIENTNCTNPIDEYQINFYVYRILMKIKWTSICIK